MAPEVVIHAVSSDALAGTERHVLGLLEELRNLGCDGRLLSRPGATVLPSEAVRRGIPCLSLTAAALRSARVVHAHDGKAALVARALVSGTKMRFVRTQHFVIPASAVRPGVIGTISTWAQRAVNRRVDAYVAVSAAARDAAARRRDVDPSKVRVIAPGVKLATAAVAQRAAKARSATNVAVVSAGRLERERRFGVLLEAARILLVDHPRCRFVIAGSGQEEARLREQARTIGVAEKIEWTGWLNGIDEILESSDIYVNTWPWEGFGMATAEAMGFGLPVIVTSSGASRELVVDGESGIVVPPEDPRSLAAAISRLIEEPLLRVRMGSHARERAQRYSVAESAAATLDLYRFLGAVH